MKVLSIFLAFVKKYVQLIILSFYFFMSQNTANFLSLVMPVLERLKVSLRTIDFQKVFFTMFFLIDA